MAAMTAAVGCCVLLGKAQADDGLSVEVVDAVEISADTNVVVEAGRTLKFEYVYGESSVTVKKSGAGRLEIATSSHTNLSVNVVEGTFASARPAAIPMTGEFKPAIRIDSSRADTMLFSAANGTNYINYIFDADGKKRYCAYWSSFTKPYVADEKCNGMNLIDFGALVHTQDGSTVPGYGAMLGLWELLGEKPVNTDAQIGIPLGSYFYVWKDRDDVIDSALTNGSEFQGPSVIGNNPGYFSRGNGGGGRGFKALSTGMEGTLKENMHLDGKPIHYGDRVPRGVHILRNRVRDGDSLSMSTIGYSAGAAGGFLLAELVVYSECLPEACAARVEAQLQSKWLGLKLNSVNVAANGFFDLSSCRVCVWSLDVDSDASVCGMENLRLYGVASIGGAIMARHDTFECVPDISFHGDAEIGAEERSRLQTVRSGTGKLLKTGAGELVVADPEMSVMEVAAGVLKVSALEVGRSEYHLDANCSKTFQWKEEEGKKLISVWYDIENPSCEYKECTKWEAPAFDANHILRKPYITENAVGNMAMVDFGSYMTVNRRYGWGGCLNGNPRPSRLHDVFVVWKDYPEVRNYELDGLGRLFVGPCFFGLEYNWTRGEGGGGKGFPIHYSGAPGGMYSPYNTGLVLVDGVEVNGIRDSVGDGVHVLSQRVLGDGVSVQMLGGCLHARMYEGDTTTNMKGVFGGVMIGEVLMFKNLLSDRLRMRISGALCSKWRGDTNEWAYGSLKVVSGATLKHPHADLVPETLELAGTLSSVSVKPGILKVEGDSAEIVGELRLAEGGTVNVVGDPENGFASVKASSVRAGGKGSIAIGFASAGAHVGEEFRIVESDDVQADADFQWRVTALQGTGVRGKLKAKSDGIYLSFEGSGMTVTVR